MICPKLYNDNSIKLQGVSYYVDCYKFWDLNHCADAFQSRDYAELIDRVSLENQRPWNQDLMVIDFSEYSNEYERYKKSLSKNVRRDIMQSKKRGFILKKYTFNSVIHDFSEINHSQKERKGSINPWYLKSADFFEGSHSEGSHPWEDSKHYGEWYGIFRQGELKTNEKLYAYCKVLVDGEMASVGLIWAHAKYLKRGLMFNLIISIVKRLMPTENIRYFVYSGAGQYRTWKERMLFKSTKIKLEL